VLPPDKAISIGRAAINQIVIDDLLVSRVHCRLTFGPTGPTLTDRESANGTLVNGRTVTETVLANGDAIQVGQQIFVVFAGTRDEAEGWVQRRNGSKTEQTITGLNVSQIRATDMVGDLTAFPLVPLLQSFVDQRRQGCLELKQAGQPLGRIWINNGNFVHAETARGTAGKAAFYEMLPARDGQFLFRVDSKPPTFSIMDNPTALLLEGCRLMDEQRL
jgi:pSer/pThr/pTyr-binding forkhead associated (FHA) protein